MKKTALAIILMAVLTCPMLSWAGDVKVVVGVEFPFRGENAKTISTDDCFHGSYPETGWTVKEFVQKGWTITHVTYSIPSCSFNGVHHDSLIVFEKK